MEQPLILLTAGLEPTQKQIPQLHLYQNYAEAVVQAGGLAVLVCSGQRESLAELSQRAQGLFLTGGEDMDRRMPDYAARRIYGGTVWSGRCAGSSSSKKSRSLGCAGGCN